MGATVRQTIGMTMDWIEVIHPNSDVITEHELGEIGISLTGSRVMADEFIDAVYAASGGRDDNKLALSVGTNEFDLSVPAVRRALNLAAIATMLDTAGLFDLGNPAGVSVVPSIIDVARSELSVSDGGRVVATLRLSDSVAHGALPVGEIYKALRQTDRDQINSADFADTVERLREASQLDADRDARWITLPDDHKRIPAPSDVAEQISQLGDKTTEELRQEPDKSSAKTHRLLMLLYAGRWLRSQDPDDLSEALDHALCGLGESSADENFVAAASHLAQQAIERGHVETARRLTELLRSAAPEHPAAIEAFTRFLCETRGPFEALIGLRGRPLRSASGTSTSLLLTTAEMSAECGDLAGALELSELVFHRRDADDPQVLVLQANILIGLSRWHEASEIAAVAAHLLSDKHSHRPEVLLALAAALADLGHTQPDPDALISQAIVLLADDGREGAAASLWLQTTARRSDFFLPAGVCARVLGNDPAPGLATSARQVLSELEQRCLVQSSPSTSIFGLLATSELHEPDQDRIVAALVQAKNLATNVGRQDLLPDIYLRLGLSDPDNRVAYATIGARMAGTAPSVPDETRLVLARMASPNRPSLALVDIEGATSIVTAGVLGPAGSVDVELGHAASATVDTATGSVLELVGPPAVIASLAGDLESLVPGPIDLREDTLAAIGELGIVSQALSFSVDDPALLLQRLHVLSQLTDRTLLDDSMLNSAIEEARVTIELLSASKRLGFASSRNRDLVTAFVLATSNQNVQDFLRGLDGEFRDAESKVRTGPVLVRSSSASSGLGDGSVSAAVEAAQKAALSRDSTLWLEAGSLWARHDRRMAELCYLYGDSPDLVSHTTEALIESLPPRQHKPADIVLWLAAPDQG